MINHLPVLYQNLPISSLEAYIHYASQVPMLSQEEEFALAHELHDNEKLSPAKKLILRSALILPHLRYVIRVAKNYMGYGLPLADLIQEGSIGLMKAVTRFNPQVGVRLVTFAVHWIKAEIHEFILRNWRIVKVATTKAQRKLFFNLRHMRKNLNWLTFQEVNDIASDLSVKPETVREMEMRLLGTDTSFDAKSTDQEHYVRSPAGFLEDHRYNPEAELEKNDWVEQYHYKIHQALESLDDRSQAIISARWLDDHRKATLQELAIKYHISTERIRQLEKNAMKKLRNILKEKA